MKYSREFKVGSIAILILFFFILFLSYLNGKDILHSKNIFKIKYNNINGLSVSKDVTLNGMSVGKVKDIKIIQDNYSVSFVVSISVDKLIKLTKNTIAEIYEPNIMSGSEIRLILNPSGDLANYGDYLKGRLYKDVMSRLEGNLYSTQDKFESLLVTLNNTFNKINTILDDKNITNLKYFLYNLNTGINKFNSTFSYLNSLSRNANNIIKNNDSLLNNAIVRLDRSFGYIENASHNINVISNDIIQYDVKSNLNNISKELNNIISNINNGKGTLGKLLIDDSLYYQIKNSTNNANILMKDIKENPSKYINLSIFGKKR